MADVEPVAKKSKPGPPVAAVMARVESPAPLSRESNRHGTHIGGNIPRLWYTVEADLYITSYVFRLVLVGMGRLAGFRARVRRRAGSGGPVACIDGICYGRGRHK